MFCSLWYVFPFFAPSFCNVKSKIYKKEKVKTKLFNLLILPTNMVRTSGGIRISAGKSSKKGGGGGSTRATPSTPSSSGKSGSSHLPPIPHCEVPSWQKPITNFFNVGASTSKEATNENDIKDHVEDIGKENDPSNINKSHDNSDMGNKDDLLQGKQNTSDVKLLENEEGE